MEVTDNLEALDNAQLFELARTLGVVFTSFNSREMLIQRIQRMKHHV